MTLEEILKAQGLTDEQISKVLADMTENNIHTTLEENIDERYSKLKGQKEALDDEIEEANKTIKSLKDANGDNEVLQQTIKDHEGTIEQLKADNESKISEITFNYALDVALRNAKVKNPKAVQALLDTSIMKVDGDKLVGLEEQIKEIKETDPYMFEDETPPSTGGSGNFGRTDSNTGRGNPFSKETLNLTEQGRLFREDPDLALKLRASAQ